MGSLCCRLLYSTILMKPHLTNISVHTLILFPLTLFSIIFKSTSSESTLVPESPVMRAIGSLSLSMTSS
ncbi:hypothetical protein L873DRAFT_1805797 [Choiromyces venosus 120613-1]|uniref:Uncharacterized protein n=1 Tax=Choiromyces venosus 120613-1 TaxID=1336337 RepID=A0A3N4JP36_9PEZI|nr:hypothetical protein L873DRAFT_1805797 [Choiromyces venosus 120613-1]